MNKQHWRRPAFSPAHEPQYARRLSDKILVAFHHACDQNDIQAAGWLLGVLDFMISRSLTLPTAKEHRARESIVAAHERLWEMRHLTLGEC